MLNIYILLGASVEDTGIYLGNLAFWTTYFFAYIIVLIGVTDVTTQEVNISYYLFVEYDIVHFHYQGRSTADVVHRLMHRVNNPDIHAKVNEQRGKHSYT